MKFGLSYIKLQLTTNMFKRFWWKGVSTFIICFRR